MKKMAAFVFPGFQTLDMYGPMEMLGAMRADIQTIIVAETPDPVPSIHGQRLMVDQTIADGSDYDLLFIPGGDTALEAMKSQAVQDWIVATATRAELVMAVCTGTVLLASTGVMDGRKATTNKIDFTETIHLGPNVEWIAEARWVEDGKFFTSSGVSAGIDMSLAAIAHMYDKATAQELADGCEYEWHDDPSWDPFAKMAGRV